VGAWERGSVGALGRALNPFTEQREVDIRSVMHAFSRNIVGWDVFENGFAGHACAVFYKTQLREGVQTRGQVLS